MASEVPHRPFGILRNVFCVFLGQTAAFCFAQERVTQERTDEYFRLFNAHDPHSMAALYAPMAEMLDPAYGTTTVNMDGTMVEAKYTELFSAIPEVHDSVVSVHRTPDGHVFVEFISTGTGPDGKYFSLPLITHMTWQNGTIVSDRTYYDNPCEAH